MMLNYYPKSKVHVPLGYIPEGNYVKVIFNEQETFLAKIIGATLAMNGYPHYIVSVEGIKQPEWATFNVHNWSKDTFGEVYNSMAVVSSQILPLED
jgi:hypothetical protein